jgi:hypothetical protein
VLNPGTASTAGHAPHAAISGRCPLAAYSVGGAMPSAFFLLNSPSRAQDLNFERLKPLPPARAKAYSNGCAASRVGPRCCTLLLYFRSSCSNYVSDQWS